MGGEPAVQEPDGAAFKKLGQLLAESGGCVVLDGGLATQLESHGANINDPLWSAVCLRTMPDLVKRVHLDYLNAGAQILVTASYQATVQGFLARGHSQEEAEALLRKSVTIACEVRDQFWADRQQDKGSGVEPGVGYSRALVAASIGSYGAFLADGSEYSGDYGPEMSLEKLKTFHRRRLQVLVEAGPDLLAFETIPSKLEAQALVELLEEEDVKVPSWICFNSNDGEHVPSGELFADCASLASKSSKVVAVGTNCTPPRFGLGLIEAARKVTSKPIIIYPNSGESYDGNTKQWVPNPGISDCGFISYVDKWREAGASLIGGCCRTSPRTVVGIREAINKHQPANVGM